MGRNIAIGAGLIAVAPVAAILAGLFFLASNPPPATAGTGPIAGIGDRALAAYQDNGGQCDGVDWALLAAIGHTETGHGTYGGATLDPVTGIAAPPIYGPPLDGTNNTQRLPIGQYQDWWGLTGTWLRAVGPMQFLPGTFDAYAIDGDDDGETNPHDIDDAVATAANYLCDGDTEPIDPATALRRYNNSTTYVTEVLAQADIYRASAAGGGGVSLVGGDWLCPVAGTVTFTDTWGAPRSGGRTHKGVDMFAATATPTVAPVAGDVDHYDSGLGGLSWRIYGDDGNYYYGTHLSAYANEGAGHVEAGTVIGYVGQTGNAATTPPHLHFEIHPGRGPGDPPGPVNPTPTVTAHCADNRPGIILERDGE